MKNFEVILLLFLLVTGCVSGDEPEAENIPVIEGYIDSNGYPIVLFTSAIIPEESGGEIADNLIRWGKVTISDGTRTVVLTGQRDDTHFPPYKYFSYDMIGTPGQTYTLSVSYKDMSATAQCQMLSPTPIDSISCSPIENEDSLRSTMLYFTAPEDVPAYYYLTVDDYPALMGWAEVRTPGEEVAIPLYNCKKYDSEGRTGAAHFKRGEIHIIGLHRVTEEVFRFWRSYDEMTMFSGNVLFGGVSSLPSNINGGLGIFAARAGSKCRLIIK